MKHFLTAMAILAALSLRAEDLTPTAATLVVTPAPLAAPWDSVMLKDGQKAEGKIRGYDAFFLDFEMKNANKAHLPWIEVAEVKPAEFSGDMAMMKQYLKNEPAEVQSVIQARNSGDAVMKALWPGIVIHGYGFKTAGNNDMFLSLAGAELFGILVGGFGASRAADSTLSQGEKDTSVSMAYGGIAIFAVTWIVDLSGASFSADNFNKSHGLALGLSPSGRGGAMTASLRF